MAWNGRLKQNNKLLAIKETDAEVPTEENEEDVEDATKGSPSWYWSPSQRSETVRRSNWHHDLLLLQEDWTHAKGVPEANCQEWSNDQSTRPTLPEQWNDPPSRQWFKPRSGRSAGFKLWLGRSVTPNTSPCISSISTKPQLITCILDEFCTKETLKINVIKRHLPFCVLLRNR